MQAERFQGLLRPGEKGLGLGGSVAAEARDPPVEGSYGDLQKSSATRGAGRSGVQSMCSVWWRRWCRHLGCWQRKPLCQLSLRVEARPSPAEDGGTSVPGSGHIAGTALGTGGPDGGGALPGCGVRGNERCSSG